MEKLVKVFGAALDVLDDPIKILTKCSYLHKLSQDLIDIEQDFKDPYDGLLLFSKILSNDLFIKMDKFHIESWLTPKPNLEDYTFINPLKFQDFINSEALKKYAINLEGYVNQNILPDIPLMIGVDHSLSGGVMRALSKKYGANDILIIIFDAHFDGITANVALNLANYAKENKDKLNILFPENLEDLDEKFKVRDTYSYASFLYYLIEEKIINPENLIIFGCQDYPDKQIRSINDKRVKDFVDFYLSFEKNGVKFIEVEPEPILMIGKLKQILDKIKKPYIYISLDVDVGVFKDILAARFMNTVGIERNIILKAAQTIKSFMKEKECELIGMDILEIDTYLLGKELKKSGKKDKTIDVIDAFLDIFFEINKKES